MEFINPMDYLKFGAAFVIVIGLIFGLAWLGRYFGLAPRVSRGRHPKKRLSITEVAPVDAKRRLVMVRRDNVEHLLLLGPTSEMLIETGIRHSDSFEDVLNAVGQDQKSQGQKPPAAQKPDLSVSGAPQIQASQKDKPAS